MRIIGQEQVADLFGVAPKTIVEWQDAGFPIAQRGSPGIPSEYESQACINWLVDREVRKVQGESQRDRYWREAGDKLAMENAVTRSRLIPADQVEPKIRAAVVSAREQLVNLRSSLVPQLIGKSRRDVEVLLEAAHTEFLTKLSRWRQADEDEDDEAPAA
jgi:phage terminase Nu1 subunit (DNA packaging protein)